jgi:predicted NodU family carbamoyl transferase
MSVILGIAGASRNAALALCDGGQVVGVCEHERITRTRSEALKPGQLPMETLETLLQLGGRSEQDISAYAVAEASIQLPPERPVEYVDHHFDRRSITTSRTRPRRSTVRRFRMRRLSCAIATAAPN